MKYRFRTLAVIITVITIGLMSVNYAAARKLKEYSNPDSELFYEAMRLFNEEDYGQAKKLFEIVAKSRADNQFSNYFLGYIAAVDNDIDEAIRRMDIVIDNVDKKYDLRADAHKSRANLYLFKKDTISGIEDLNIAIKLDATDTESIFRRAEIYREIGNLSRSDADYERILQSDPGNMDARLGLINNNVRRGDKNTAAEGLNMLFLDDPYNTELYYKSIAIYEALGNRENAVENAIAYLYSAEGVEDIDRISSADPATLQGVIETIKENLLDQEDTRAYWNLAIGEIYNMMERYGNAIASFSAASEADNNSYYRLRMADTYTLVGQYNKALGILPAEEEIFEGYLPQYWRCKAMLMSFIGNESEAREALLNLHHNDLGDAFAYLIGGYLNLKTGRNADCVESFVKLLSMTADNSGPAMYSLYMIGEAYDRMGNNQKAEEYWKRAESASVDADPKDFEEKGIVAVRNGKTAEAEEIAGMLADTEGDLSVSNKVASAQIYAQLGEKEKANAALRRAIKEGYDNAGAIESDILFEPLHGEAEYEHMIEALRGKD